MVLIDFKVYFQGQKGSIWTFVIYLGQSLRNGACYGQCLYEAHITKSYMIFQFTNQGHIPFKGLCVIKGASYDQSLYDIHIVSHIWPLSLTCDI